MPLTLTLLIATFGVSAFFNALANRFFLQQKKTDPVNHRSSHRATATRSGGIGIFFTLACLTMYFYAKGDVYFSYGLLIPLGVIFVTGLYDDLYEADFKIKFILQLLVAKIIIDQGYVIDHFYGILGLETLPRFIAQLFTAFVFLVIVNAINLIDGLDGLAISVSLFVLGVFLFLVPNSPLLGFCQLLVAALLPLYYFNFRPSRKVFLGDAGSLLLGTVICIVTFDFLDPETRLAYEFQINRAYLAILILAYPLMDLFRVFMIRMKNGKSPFLPDNNHLHHLILQKTGRHVLATLSIVFIAGVFLLIHLLIGPLINDLIMAGLDFVFLIIFGTFTFKTEKKESA